MMDETEHRLMMIEGRQKAVINLLLSFIVASDEKVILSTRLFAAEQRDQAFKQGEVVAGMVLDDLLKAIDEVRPTAAND